MDSMKGAIVVVDDTEYRRSWVNDTMAKSLSTNVARGALQDLRDTGWTS